MFCKLKLYSSILQPTTREEAWKNPSQERLNAIQNLGNTLFLISVITVLFLALAKLFKLDKGIKNFKLINKYVSILTIVLMFFPLMTVSRAYPELVVFIILETIFRIMIELLVRVLIDGINGK